MFKMEARFRKYRNNLPGQYINSLSTNASNSADSYHHERGLTTLFSLLDLTTLNTTDTDTRVAALCEKVNQLPDQFPETPNVAAICIYPSLVLTARGALKAPGVKIASVAGGFPSSQTYLKIKLAEVEMALDQGATEIDVVISLGKFLCADYVFVEDELRKIKNIIKNNHLKVILETGALSQKEIYMASLLAMEAGADFIKTSTGKLQPAATIEAVAIMCTAVQDFFSVTGRRVGIKPAGGISSTSDALPYLALVSEILGDDWINAEYFRFGASRLANNLLSDLAYLRTGQLTEIKYF